MIENTYETAKKLFGLKGVQRSGWVHSSISNPESVADHSWGTALLCLLFSEHYNVDRQRALEISIIHDAAEVVIGDIPSTAQFRSSQENVLVKSELERAAASELFHGPSMASFHALWDEYEASESKEALVVRDLNLIDMALQALLYAVREPEKKCDLEVFISSAGERLLLQESEVIFALIKQDFGELYPRYSRTSSW